MTADQTAQITAEKTLMAADRTRRLPLEISGHLRPNQRSSAQSISGNLRCGQSTIEYAVGITVVLAALIVMQAYVKRGMQARLRTVVDGTTKAIGAPTQYEPYYASATSVVTGDSQVTFTYAPGGTITTSGRSTSVVDPGAKQSMGVDLKADDDWQ